MDYFSGGIIVIPGGLMKRVMRILIILMAIVVISVAMGCQSGPDASVQTAGRSAPDFQLQSLDGLVISLSSLKGRPVMVNFWATWCGYCVKEMPYLQAASVDSELLARGLVLLGVNIQETRPAVRGFVNKYGITFPVLLDTDARVAGLYNVSGIPITFFIDKDGIIRNVRLGPFADKAEIERILSNSIMRED
jgi:peroxiredoxin